MAAPTSPRPLALFGGVPVRTTPLPGWPHFDQDEIDAVDTVLRSGRVNYWTGTEAREFEREFAEFTGRKHAVAVANGTVALELALVALGVGTGDEVVVASRTFIATASAVVMRGGIPVCADVDRTSGCVTADSIREVLTERTRAVIVVHLGGWVADMDPIVDLAREHGLYVIEDVAQALGGRYKGRPAGSAGHMAAFSFCQDKIMTTAGEGGMLVCDDDDLWSRAWSFKDHGKSWDAVYAEPRATGIGFRWLHESFGTNWRMTEVQAAIGRVALRKVPAWVERRRANAARLDETLGAFESIRLAVPPPDVYHAYYKYYAYVVPGHLKKGWDRTRIAEAIVAEGVPCQTGSCPEIYLERAFTASGLSPARPLAVAHELGETSLVLLVHPTLRDNDVLDVCTAAHKVLSEASLR
ncbi:MAG: aminotransferase [Actinobacteria bacterium HGW-Actinobacteria-10]|jgi:hypothetical protein|nr:MAG: aminotransferase [Actinobacteria bacterium HGW-Actinobacteria-10]